MRILDIHPAFGFETKERWQVAVHQREEYLQEKGENLASANHRLWAEARIGLNNVSKILVCIPVINIIVGIARICLNIKKSDDPVKKAISERHIKRGVTEIFVGPLLIFADIFQTIRDRKIVKDYMLEHPETYHIRIN